MSTKSRQRRTRKHRRQGRAALKFGPDAKPKHRSKSGRTGKVQQTHRKSRRGPAGPARKEER